MVDRQEPTITGEDDGLPRHTVVILAPDLFFSSRLEDVVQTLGGHPVSVENAEEFVAAVDHYFPVLAMLDLQSPGDWETAIQRCKMRPHTRAVPIYAFGSHVDVDVLKRARQAGADHAWARSKMMEELVATVQHHLNPPIRQLEGCDEPLSKLAVAGLLELNHGEYFEQHEYLELAWVEEKRPIRDLYQGILQVGVAFLQIQKGNWHGALKMMRRGLPKLRDLPPVCRGVQLEPFRRVAEAIHREISLAGPDQLHQLDQKRFPKVEFHNPYTGQTPAELGVEIQEE
jgi:CheY-like chemotaxis protein